MEYARSLFVVIALAGCGHAWANAPKNSDFMKLSEGQRRWWYHGTYTTLGHVLSLEDEVKAKCVWNWYFDAPERKEALLEKSFALYPDHAPSSIVIALLRRDCGVFPKATGVPTK